MGSVERSSKITNGRPGYYLARGRDPAGAQGKRRGPTKRGADRSPASVETRKPPGSYTASDTPTVAEYARQWAASRPHRASTARRVESIIAHQIEATPLGSR